MAIVAILLRWKICRNFQLQDFPLEAMKSFQVRTFQLGILLEFVEKFPERVKPIKFKAD